jgi:hypothetical protein
MGREVMGLNDCPMGARIQVYLGVDVGTYKNNKPHGIGKYEWSNGEFYEGEWIEGNKHGSGMWRGVDGDSYIG